jgi:anti-sigma-K factor RskA
MSDNLHTLLGPYALDAVTSEEHEAFEQHLHTCAACREELEGLQETAARLGVAVAAPPSAELRTRIMDAITRTPQERPRMAAVIPGPWRRWAPRMLAAAAVLAVVASLGAFLVERGRVQDLTNQQATVSAVLAANDAEDRVVELDGDARLRVVSSPSLGQAVVVSANMPDAGPDKDYEVWSVGDEGPESLGLMEPDSDGDARVQLLDGLDDATALAITVEPEGGSPSGRPTTTPIVQVDLA